MINPINLPKEHVLRNTPIKDLRIEIRNLQSKMWRDCRTWGIKNATFNELADFWLELNEWRILEESDLNENKSE